MNSRAIISRLAALLIILPVLGGCSGEGQASLPAAHTGTPAATVARSGENNSTSATATVSVETSRGGSSQPFDVSKVDPCGLLSKADIESVMGPVEYSPDNQKPTCVYVQMLGRGDSNEGGKQVEVVVWETDYWEQQQVLHAGAQSVAGVGDEAFTDELPLWQGLWVLLRDRAVVQVHVFPKDVESAKKLALKAIEKLP